MIPSDHFVRFYNEVFKYLDSRNGLAEYYGEISRHQDFHCLELFRKKGLEGVREYYLKIRKEENCDLEILSGDHELILFMKRCPSLSKALDNDAGACPKYCLHCPGWTLRVYREAGLFQIYDLMGLENPQCCEYIFDDRSMAERRYRELAKSRDAQNLRINFEMPETL